jgi:hypothetical protein
MTTRTITKLEAAQRQLTTAIRMFFADGDPVAVHTLVCAAREIYEKHCRKAGQGRMFDFLQASNPGRAEKELWNLLNAARNFFKHEGDSLDQSIEFDDTMNDFAILSACTDCATLCSPNQPVEVQAFSIWFVAVESPDEQAMTEAEKALWAKASRRCFSRPFGRTFSAFSFRRSDLVRRLYRSSGQAGVNQSASFLFFGIQTFDIGCEALVAIEREKSQR